MRLSPLLHQFQNVAQVLSWRLALPLLEGSVGEPASASRRAPTSAPPRLGAPFFEFLPAPLAESRLRRELIPDDYPLVDGRVRVPDRPGLGVEVDEPALVGS
jgi:L-alanine-DL-glutamate epimerase-like enolase superfamily enzyme